MTNANAKFAGLALITALLIVGLITPALAEHEVETIDCSNPFADIPFIGKHPPKNWRCKEGTEPKPFKVTCYQGGEKIISLNPVFNARQNKYWVHYEKADGATAIIRKAGLVVIAGILWAAGMKR